MYQLIINTKAYSQASGEEYKKLLKACKSLNSKAKKQNVELILAPQLPELKETISSNITTFSQHIDPIAPGSNTGFVAPETMKSLGCQGTLLNHSEHTLSKKLLEGSINKAKQEGLLTCVCAKTPSKIKEIVSLSPDMVAFEPPELIGGDVSVTTRPKSVTQALDNTNGISLLIGAGVKTKEDVAKAVELGAQGILVASGVVKAENPKKVIEDLIEGFVTKSK